MFNCCSQGHREGKIKIYFNSTSVATCSLTFTNLSQGSESFMFREYMWVCMSLVLLPQKWPRILEGNACLTWSFPDRGGVLSRNSKLSHTWGATRTRGRRTWKPLQRPSPSSLATFYAIGSVGKENRAPNHYRPHLFSVLGQGFSNLSVRTTNPRILVKRRF